MISALPRQENGKRVVSIAMMKRVEAATVTCRRCTACDAIYTGPLDVGQVAKCESCGDPLIEHGIATHATTHDPATGAAVFGFDPDPHFR
jgi:rRNA maturation endonuclease Nob1